MTKHYPENILAISVVHPTVLVYNTNVLPDANAVPRRWFLAKLWGNWQWHDPRSTLFYTKMMRWSKGIIIMWVQLKRKLFAGVSCISVCGTAKCGERIYSYCSHITQQKKETKFPRRI